MLVRRVTSGERVKFVSDTDFCDNQWVNVMPSFTIHLHHTVTYWIIAHSPETGWEPEEEI